MVRRSWHHSICHSTLGTSCLAASVLTPLTFLLIFEPTYLASLKYNLCQIIYHLKGTTWLFCVKSAVKPQPTNVSPGDYWQHGVGMPAACSYQPTSGTSSPHVVLDKGLLNGCSRVFLVMSCSHAVKRVFAHVQHMNNGCCCQEHFGVDNTCLSSLCAVTGEPYMSTVPCWYSGLSQVRIFRVTVFICFTGIV